MTYYAGSVDTGGTVVKVSDRHDLGVTKKRIEASGVVAELTAFDVANVAYDVTPIGKSAKSSGRADFRTCRLRLCTSCREVHSFDWGAAASSAPFLQVVLSGGVELCFMDKSREKYRRYRRSDSGGYRHEPHGLPRLGIELLDETGFLLRTSPRLAPPSVGRA